MKIIYKTGDCLTGEERYILHGCNAQGEMGGGIARQIRDRFPQAYTAYRRAYEEHKAKGRSLELGQTIWANCADKVIINGITQEFYGPDARLGKVYVDYDAVTKVIRQINASAHFTQRSDAMARFHGGPVDAVAMPLIGAGLAGGSWARIAQIIEEQATEFQPVVYLFDGKMPTN